MVDSVVLRHLRISFECSILRKRGETSAGFIRWFEVSVKCAPRATWAASEWGGAFTASDWHTGAIAARGMPCAGHSLIVVAAEHDKLMQATWGPESDHVAAHIVTTLVSTYLSKSVNILRDSDHGLSRGQEYTCKRRGREVVYRWKVPTEARLPNPASTEALPTLDCTILGQLLL